MIAPGERTQLAQANPAGQLSPSDPIGCPVRLGPGEGARGRGIDFANPRTAARKTAPSGRNAWVLWEEQADEVNISILRNH